MRKLKYLVIHCSDTPETMNVTSVIIRRWHMGPHRNPDGTVVYLGKKYESVDLLPDHKIGDVSIKLINGRGWDRLGYSDIIHRSGAVENITPYNDDDIVDASEVTWGAAGVNSVSRHVVLIGGWFKEKSNKIFDFFDIFTNDQFFSLNKYIGKVILSIPDIKIIGHNQVPGANKTCPNFDVQEFLRMIKVPKKNIGI